MTEADWLASDDPAAMLHHLTHEDVDGGPLGVNPVRREQPLISPRKLRLFACACCRQMWDRLTDERSRRAVEVAERYADGEADKEERAHVGLENVAVWSESGAPGYSTREYARATAVGWCIGGYSERLEERVRQVSNWLEPDLPLAVQAPLLRDICGNPWRPVLLCPDWLTPTVRAIAQAAYQERGRECGKCQGQGEIITLGQYGQRQHIPCPDCKYTGRIDDGTLDPARLAVLSDALEEAGCTEEAILRHLRGRRKCTSDICLDGKNVAALPAHRCFRCDGEGWLPLRGPHVRGCWVLDLLLGKE